MSRLFWQAGLVGLAVWLILLLTSSEELVLWIEQYLSPDGHVANSFAVLAKLTAALIFGWMFLPIPYLTWRPATVMAIFRNSSTLDRLETMLILALLLVFVIAILQWGRWQSPDTGGWLAGGRLHGEDGLLENLTAVFAVAASVTLLLAARGRSRASQSLTVALAIVSFVFGMEEVSWGQRIFGVATPEVLVEANRQRELNLHNLLGPRQVHLYGPFAATLLLATYFCFANRLAALFPEDLRPLTFPAHRNFLSLVFQFLMVMHSGEVTEEVISVVLFFSAIRLLNDNRGTPSACDRGAADLHG